ncbi:hypothetical protein MTO96_035027 [Rhipicephalus appendiculatus]
MPSVGRPKPSPTLEVGREDNSKERCGFPEMSSNDDASSKTHQVLEELECERKRAETIPRARTTVKAVNQDLRDDEKPFARL